MYSICSKYLFFGDPSVLIRFLVGPWLFDLSPGYICPICPTVMTHPSGQENLMRSYSRDANGHVT